MQPVIYAADIGSIAGGKFGWARIDLEQDDIDVERDHDGAEIAELVEAVVGDLARQRPVVLGFECPLFVPVPPKALDLGKARKGEGSRSFSAGAGTGALVTGLVQTAWILRALRERCPGDAAFLSWTEFAEVGHGLFLWEAFVSGTGKGVSHVDDALIAATAFREALPDPWNANAIEAPSPLSLIGSALLWSGWSQDLTLLHEPCLVIKAGPPVDAERPVAKAEPPADVKRPVGKAGRRLNLSPPPVRKRQHDWVVWVAEQIPRGRWTAYSDIAEEIKREASGLTPRPQGVAGELKKDPDIANAHRILTVDGKAPDQYPYGLALLKSEGVRFPNGRADPKQRWPVPGP